jgi:hypothetical protein
VTYGGTATVNVSCYQGTIAADLAFMVSYEDNNEPFPDLAYTYYDPTLPVDGNTGLQTVNPARSSNFTEIPATFQFGGVFNPPSLGFPMEHVTADGSGPTFCNFGNGPSWIRCFDPSGTPQVNVPFSYVIGMGRIPASGLRGAYGVNNIAPGDNYIVEGTFFSQNSSFSDSPMPLARVSTGVSDVTILGAAAAGSNVLIQVTALDLEGHPAYCKAVTWSAFGNDVLLQVACFLMPGSTPIDDGYQMSYVVAPGP